MYNFHHNFNIFHILSINYYPSNLCILIHFSKHIFLFLTLNYFYADLHNILLYQKLLFQTHSYNYYHKSPHKSINFMNSINNINLFKLLTIFSNRIIHQTSIKTWFLTLFKSIYYQNSQFNLSSEENLI